MQIDHLPSTISIPLNSTGQLDVDLHCMHCRYNLRGLGPAGQCPECGWPIRSTLQQSGVAALSWSLYAFWALQALLGYLLLFEYCAWQAWVRTAGNPYWCEDLEETIFAVILFPSIAAFGLVLLSFSGRRGKKRFLVIWLATIVFSIPALVVADAFLNSCPPLSLHGDGWFASVLFWGIAALLVLVQVSRHSLAVSPSVWPQVGLWCFTVVLLALPVLYRLCQTRSTCGDLAHAVAATMFLFTLPTLATLIWLSADTWGYRQQLKNSVLRQDALLTTHPHQ